MKIYFALSMMFCGFVGIVLFITLCEILINWGFVKLARFIAGEDK